MNKLLRQAAVLGVFLLSACSGSPDTGSTVSGSTSAQNSAKNLGVIRISVTGLGTPNPSATAVNLNDPASGNSKSSSLSTDPCFLQLNPTAVDAGTFSVVTSAPGVTPVVYETYSSFTFQVRNAQGASGTVSGVSCTNDQANSSTLSNITLLGLVDPTATIDGTPFVSLTEFNGTKEPASTALSMLPTHGMVYNPETDTAQVQVGSESLQVFTEAQVDSLTVDTNNGAGSYLLPYGFVVRNVNPALGRTLQANPAAGEYDGQFTFAVKQSNNGNKSTAVYAFVYDLQAVTDSDTRVTQSVEEDNALGDVAANIRAATLGSTDLAVLNDGHVTASNIGDPICTVRTAGTHASPTAYLVPGSGSANTEPTVASAPYNLQYLATNSTINVGFCTTMIEPTTSNLVVSGSQTGLHTGSYGGGGTALLSFTPTKPFLVGELVSYTLTTGLTAVGSGNNLAVPFVGSYTTGGTVASAGQFVAPVNNVTVGSGPVGIATADFNGDGIADLAVTNYNYYGSGSYSVSILLGNGLGGYTTSTVTLGSSYLYGPYGIAVGDFNGDGKPDIAVANTYNATITILLNNGSGGFSATSGMAAGDSYTVAGGSYPQFIAVGDFNGDGQPDLAVTGDSNSVTILLGNGSSGFSATSGMAAGDSYSVNIGNVYGPIAVGDFNGDGKPDLAVADFYGPITIMLGNGSSGFSATSGTAAGDSYSIYTLNDGTDPDGITVGDFNGDGKPDLAVANNESGTVSILLNNGSGIFSTTSGMTAGDSYTVNVGTNPDDIAMGDFNGDGKPDLAVTNNTAGTVSILLGNGSSGFSATSGMAAGDSYTVSVGSSPYGIAVGAFNRDGHPGFPDLAVVNDGSNNVSILLNNGSGVFAASTFAVGGAPDYVAVGDFNGDGIPDVAVTNNSDGTVSILLGNGLGGYTPASGSPVTVGTSPAGIAVGDFNGDGHPDLAVANEGSSNVTILLNNGSGVFSATSGMVAGDSYTVGAGSGPAGIAVGDFNGDGKPDLAVTNVTGGSVTILLGNGSSGFTTTSGMAAGDSYTVNVGARPLGIAVGDFNSDGKPDLAVADSTGGSVTILLGNGSSGFSATSGMAAGDSYTVSASHPIGVAVGDFNGDGQPDLAVATSGSTVTILLGNGSNGFSSTSGMTAGDSYTVNVGSSPDGIAVGDFNGDGHPDLAVANLGSNTVSILLNNGSGVFSATPGTAAGDSQTIAVGSSPLGIAVGDFFGTHQLGLVVVNNGANTVQLLQQ